jgi:hypothetical protein
MPGESPDLIQIVIIERRAGCVIVEKASRGTPVDTDMAPAVLTQGRTSLR